MKQDYHASWSSHDEPRQPHALSILSPAHRADMAITSHILQARHVYISVEVCNWKIRRTGKAHFTLLLSGVQPVTILWITTAHVLLSLPCSVHGHLLPLWRGPQLSLCVHSELPPWELWLLSNHIRGRRREVWWREDSTGYHISEEFILGMIGIQIWVYIYYTSFMNTLILQAPRHGMFISVEVCNWKIRRTGKAHFTLLLSGVQPVTILWITTAHVLLSLPCSVHGHLLPLWGGPQLSLCVHSELHTSELWLPPNHIRGRRREVWWREDSTGYHISEELILGIIINQYILMLGNTDMGIYILYIFYECLSGNWG